MLSLIVLLLGTAILSGVESQCPGNCSINILDKYPGNNGYRASVTVLSPVWVRRRRRVVIRMKFDKLVEKVQHVHIVGGRLRIKGSNIEKNEVKLLFRPQATIRKGKSKVKIEFTVRATADPPVLVEVRFWRKTACSNLGCPSNVTTTKPVITKIPTTKPSPTEPVPTTKKPEPVTEEPEQKTSPAPATEPPIKTEGPEVTEASEEKTTPAPATEPPVKTEGPVVTEAPEEKTTFAPPTELPTKKPDTEEPEEKSTPAATKPSVIIGAV